MPKPKKQFLKLHVNGQIGQAERAAYVTAKTKQLIEFGYAKLTEQQVNDQITAIIDKQPLNVIGMFMEKEVLGVI